MIGAVEKFDLYVHHRVAGDDAFDTPGFNEGLMTIETVSLDTTTGEPGVWKPVIHEGHCIRCGLCVEICPELVLEAGRVHPMNARDGTYMQFTFHIQVNPVTCMGCGNCSVACPVNKEIDPSLAAKGTSSSEDVIMRVNRGLMTVFHEELCTGCKTCEEQCPTRSIMIARFINQDITLVHDPGKYDPGDQIRFSIDDNHLHLFHKDTGLSLAKVY